MGDFSALLDSLEGDQIKTVAKACIIVWHDTWEHIESWVDFPLHEADDTEPIAMTTMGYLIHANEKAVVIAGTIDFEYNQMGQVQVIPRGCIVSITPL